MVDPVIPLCLKMLWLTSRYLTIAGYARNPICFQIDRITKENFGKDL